MPSSPSSPSSRASSREGTSPESNHSPMSGSTRSPTQRRTVSRSMRSSSPSRWSRPSTSRASSLGGEEVVVAMPRRYSAGVTDVRHALERLQVPGGSAYYRSRIPCPEDSAIARAVHAFATATPREQAAFRAGVDRTRAVLLQVWSERLAALAVRLDSTRPLVLGLVGLSLAQGDDEEALLVAPLHRR